MVFQSFFVHKYNIYHIHVSTELTGSLPDGAMKNDAEDFLLRKNAYSKMRCFRQTLRHEILFALVPRTFEPGTEQRAALYEVANLLTEKGYLRDQGLNQLGTIRKFCKIINKSLHFRFKTPTIEDFCSQSKFRS